MPGGFLVHHGRPAGGAALNTLTLSASSFLDTDPATTVIGAIQGLTAGSSVAVSPADGRVAISGTNLAVGSTPASVGSFSITLVETKTGASNTPHPTPLNISVSSASVNASLAFPNSGYRKIDTLTGFQAWLDTVHDTNLVTTTVAGTIPLLVWPLRSVVSGTPRTWVRRELREMLLVQGTGQTLGNTGTVTFSGKTGASGTGSLTTFTVGLAVSNAAPTSIDIGAKTHSRCGGQLLSLWGATSITTQKDGSGNVISTNLPFEVFGGRIVWAATDGTASTYGTTRVVPYSSGIVGTGKYTLILNNGTTLTVDVIDNRADAAPSPVAVSDASGDNVQIAIAMPYRYAGDIIMCEDGAYNNAGSAINCWVNYAGASGTGGGANPDGQVTVNPAGGPALPSATELSATVERDLSQAGSPGFVRIRARHPLGVTFNFPTRFEPTALGNDPAPLNMLFEYMDMRSASPDAYGLYTGTVSWTQREGLLATKPNANMHISWLGFRYNRMGADAHVSATADGVTHHHLFMHDNFFKDGDNQTNTYCVDSEFVGNWFEGGVGHDFHGIIYNSTAGSHLSKVWWNTHIHKGIVDGATHPNLMLQIFSIAPDNKARLNPLFAADPTNGGVGWELASIVGNVAFSGRRRLIGIAGAGYSIGDDAPDSQCYNMGDMQNGLVFVRALGNILNMGNYNIGFNTANQIGTFIFRDNILMASWHCPATLNGRTSPALLLRTDGNTNGTGATIIYEGNVGTIPPQFPGVPAWGGTVTTASGNPNVDNLSTEALYNFACVTPDPGANVDYLSDMLAAAAPVAPGSGGVLFPSGKTPVGSLARGDYDYRRRTWPTARINP